jgi:non-specific serine/threonine protein kinase
MKAAALFRLQELVDSNQLGETDTEFNQQHTVIKMKQLEIRSLKLLSAPDILPAAEDYLRSHKANITEAANDLVKAEMTYEGRDYLLQIRRNDDRTFDTSCNCKSETKHPLCLHKAILLLQLLTSYGPTYFDSISNRDREKNKLLALYGYTTDDDIEGKFEFTYREGKPFLRVLDPSIKRVTAPPVEQRKPFFVPVQKETEVEEKPAEVLPRQKLGFVLRYDDQQYPYAQVDVVKGEADYSNKAIHR